MEMMMPPELMDERIRPLKRVEYERLTSLGCFDDERVELLFGMVVEMTPIDPAHSESTYQVRSLIEAAIGARGKVMSQSPFAASDISEPEPDVFVVPPGAYWHEHPASSCLIVEVARSSLARDRGMKARMYGFAQVDEYWIVNHVDNVVEVYRDTYEGTWRTKTIHRRGERITMLAFPDVSVAVADVLPPA